jgi:phosphoenolpyruvate carboxykinase (ATP)
MPNSCPNVPTEILHPRNTWADKAAYDTTANNLADKFNKNFAKFEDGASDDIKNAAPKAAQSNA